MMDSETSAQWDNLRIEEEEEGGILIDNGEESNEIEFSKWSLVGRFLSDRSINFLAMKNTMASLWRPMKGVFIKELREGLYVFQFFHEKDLTRVLQGGPWTFGNNVLLYQKLEPNIHPSQVSIFKMEIWIQVHDLPVGYMSERIKVSIGNYVGEFIEADPKNFNSLWRSYIRIRVAMDVRKPLKRRMKIKKPSGEWFWIHFKYERLPQFCFYCGVVGHTDNFCEILFNTEEEIIVRPYDVSLRAVARRAGVGGGERWLRTEAGENIGGSKMEVDGNTELMPQFSGNNPNARKSSNEGFHGNNLGSTSKANSHIHTIVGLSQQTSKESESLLQKEESQGIMLIDGKKRRIGGEEEKMNEDGVELNSIVGLSKNGPEAGLVDQACLSQ